tara:strand:+ start:1455 stop:1967 length:513 start_codon:yes stop_codon:yes gene_type:complete
MSQIKVNSIVPAGGLPSGSNGGIIQVVQAVKTDTFSHNSTSFTDLTGLSATITPSSSSNKILIDTRIYISLGIGNGSTTAKFNFVRGSTTIAQPASGSSNHECTFQSWGNNAYMQVRTMDFLDSPATTNATTYKVQVAGDNTAATIWVNRYYHTNNYTGISTLTLYEVST